MSDEAKVASALTPEEWATVVAGGSVKRPGVEGAEYVKLTAGVCVEGFREKDSRPDDPLADCDCGEVGFDNARHSLAALALHGQPFGFTREDARTVRMALQSVEIFPYLLPEEVERLHSLASRIEALLPPEAQ